MCFTNNASCFVNGCFNPIPGLTDWQRKSVRECEDPEIHLFEIVMTRYMVTDATGEHDYKIDTTITDISNDVADPDAMGANVDVIFDNRVFACADHVDVGA